MSAKFEKVHATGLMDQLRCTHGTGNAQHAFGRKQRSSVLQPRSVASPPPTQCYRKFLPGLKLASCASPLTRHEIHFQANADGVFEEYLVVPGCTTLDDRATSLPGQLAAPRWSRSMSASEEISGAEFG